MAATQTSWRQARDINRDIKQDDVVLSLMGVIDTARQLDRNIKREKPAAKAVGHDVTFI